LANGIILFAKKRLDLGLFSIQEARTLEFAFSALRWSRGSGTSKAHFIGKYVRLKFVFLNFLSFSGFFKDNKIQMFFGPFFASGTGSDFPCFLM
jgi:hypothetical protein